MKRVGITFAALGAFVGAAMLARAAADVPGRPVPSIVREVTSAVGFEDDDLARMWRGEIVSRSIAAHSKRELAIAVIMRIRESHRDFFDRLRRGQLFAIDRTVIHVEEVPAKSAGPAVFSELHLDATQLSRLGRATPGAEFNLSQPEIDALNLAAEAGDDAVLGEYRRVLAGRLRAYRRSGIDGISPYLRAGANEALPAVDLRLAITSLGGLASRCPSFYESFARFPASRNPKVTHQLFWTLQLIQSRPTVILSHWAMQLHDEFAVVGERQFYVGQGYDALQVVVGAFAIGEDESLVFYVNRTATDQVTGFGSSLSRMLGRRVMLREVTALFRKLRESGAVKNVRR